MKALITRKVGMMSTVNEDGAVLAVTLLSANPNVVTQLKSQDTDGYIAVQVGAEPVKTVNKPLAGHVKKAKVTPSIIREFRVDDFEEDLAVGSTFTAEVFSVGDTVKVTGVSKGKGWA